MVKKNENIIKIKNNDLINEIHNTAIEFPKYTTQIINLANQNSQGTRPPTVGQLSELIQKCPYKNHSKWKEWYLKKYPRAIDNATDKIDAMISELKKSILKIDRPMIKKWVEDLVIDKSFIGLKFQEILLKKLSKIKKTTYRLSNPDEESLGIDGYLGNIPISIKPFSYKTKNMLSEKINVKIIYYEKTKEGLLIDISQLES